MMDITEVQDALNSGLMGVHLGVPLSEKKVSGFSLQSSLPRIGGREGFTLQSLTQNTSATALSFIITRSLAKGSG